MSNTSATVVSAAPHGNGARTLTYQPALDGVRAVAVSAVLLFHGGVALFSGGYLGVSVFFTLSGFLITSLLVAEVDRTGGVDLARFYARRLRRLLPASVLCVVGVIVIARLTDWFDGVSQLRSHAIGSLLQVANWTFLFGGGSYQDLLDRSAGASSPLEHYWSLAIEEQFYWLWPLLFVWLSRRARTRRRRLRVLAAATFTAALAAPIVAAVWGVDAAYWSTPARASEILVGALLAVAVAGRSVSPRWAPAAPVALTLLLAAMVLFPAGGGPAYGGALPLVAVVSAALLLGLQAPGPVRQGLSARPLVWLGRISYGVYLYHWPIFLILDGERTGLDGVALFVVRVGATLAIAQLSSTLFELPIRRAESFTLGRTLTIVGMGTAAALVAAVVVLPASASSYWQLDPTVSQQAAIDIVDEPVGELVAVAAPAPATPLSGSDSVTPPAQTAEEPDVDDAGAASAPQPLPELSRPLRVIVAGDSVAEATGVGVVQWALLHPDLAQAEIVAEPGCGFVRGGERQIDDEWFAVPQGCNEWMSTILLERVDAAQPDVVALMTGGWDLLNRRYAGGPALETTDAEMVEIIRADLASVTGDVLDHGAGAVVWIHAPVPDPLWLNAVSVQEDLARHAVLFDVLTQLAATRPHEVYVLDLPAHLRAVGGDTDQTIRPDGVHFTPEAALALTEDYLGEQLIRAALALDPT